MENNSWMENSSIIPHQDYLLRKLQISAMSGATRSVALNISKAFDRIWHAGLLHKLKSYGVSGWIFSLALSFLRNRGLRVALDRKSSKKYTVNSGVPQGSILDPILFQLYFNDLLCNIVIYADDTTLYSKCDQVSDL